MHEYSFNGHPRHKILYGVTFLAMTLSAFASEHIHNLLKFFHITVSFSISAFVLFRFLYFLLNKYIWQCGWFAKNFHFPDLNGEWQCDGVGINCAHNCEFPWQGTINIIQTWDKILVALKTEKSTSSSLSVVGNLKHIPGVGYKLSYHYENTPGISEAELRKHEGVCNLTFTEDLKGAEGYYFNNIKERASFGKMSLIKKGDS